MFTIKIHTIVILLACICLNTSNAQVRRSTKVPRRTSNSPRKESTPPTQRRNNKKNTLKRFVITPKVGPSIQLDWNKIEEDWGWVHEEKQLTKAIKGRISKRNVYYFKNIKKNSFIGLSSDYEHIIVTDTLFTPIGILNTDSNPRRDRSSHIRIIANHIVQENPIKLSSVRLRNKTTYSISSYETISSTVYEKANTPQRNPALRFAQIDGDIEVYKAVFRKGEKVVSNRLFIEIMEQIASNLLSETNPWKRDKLMVEFQKYRHLKVKTAVLSEDKEYRNRYNAVCGDFEALFSNQKVKSVRKINETEIVIEGDVNKLHLVPFKYYALPTIARLTPIMNQSTGKKDQLGNCFFDVTGESNLKISLELILDYDDKKLDEVNQTLKSLGYRVEKNPPKTLLLHHNQTLKINGKPTGEIIPINQEVLRLEIDIPDKQLSLLKLFPQDNSTTFDLISKTDAGFKELHQNITLHVAKELIQHHDYEHLIKKFNIIQNNTLTDHIKVSSQLSPLLEPEGSLQYVEISLQLLFDNEQAFWGPFRLSSYSTLAAAKNISFIKHSENYTIKVSGTAFYEFGKRTIKDDYTTDGKFIVLQENMFKN